MINRIQTLYLGLVILLSIIEVYRVSDINGSSAIFYKFLSALCLIAIFNYKNRKTQMLISKIGTLLSMGVLIYLLYKL